MFRYSIKKIVIFILILMIIIISNNLLLELKSYFCIMSLLLLLLFIANGLRKTYNPAFIFGIFFYLYSIGYPYIASKGLSFDIYNISNSYMQLTVLYFSFYALGFLIIPKLNLIDSKVAGNINLTYSSKLNKIFSFIIVCYSILYKYLGFSHKNEIYATGSSLLSFGIQLGILQVYLMVFYQIYYDNINSKYDLDNIALNFVSSFLMTFFTGERDIFFRFLLLTLILYLKKNPKINFKFIALLSFSLFSIPFFTKYKYFGLTGLTNEIEGNFLSRFIKSDFESAGKNFQIILNDSSLNFGIFKFKSLLPALLRSLRLQKFLGGNFFSSLNWYNQRYFSEFRSGQGFSLFAEIYLNFSKSGGFLFFTALGMFFTILHELGERNIKIQIISIICLPAVIYSLRGDLTTLFSAIIHHGILPYYSFVFYNHIIKVLSKD